MVSSKCQFWCFGTYRRLHKCYHLISKDRRSSGRARNEVTYFYVGDLFCIYLGSVYANFQEKISPETSGKKFQTFHCSNVTTMKSLELFPRRFRRDFFLKIGIHRAKVYTKKVPNIEVCDFIPGSSRTSPIFTYKVVTFMQPSVGTKTPKLTL